MATNKPNIHKSQIVSSDRRINGKKVCYKNSQSVVYNGRKRVITDVMTPAPNQDSLTNGTQIKYFLEQNSVVGEIKSLTLRFQVTRGFPNQTTLAPCPYWFDRIEIYNRSTGQEISRMHGDILFTYLNMVSTEQVNQWSQLVGYNENTLRSAGFVVR